MGILNLCPCRKWLPALLCFLFYTPIFNAQPIPACPIHVDNEPDHEMSRRVPRNAYTQTIPVFSPWINIDDSEKPDGEEIENSMPGYTFSQTLFLNRFDFQIPEDVEVTGIQVKIRGRSDDRAAVKEQLVRLTNGHGHLVGQNKAGLVISGPSWPDTNDVDHDMEWMYGFNNDTWDYAWTPALINDEGFGVAIQLYNGHDDSTAVFIDQVQILIHFEPLVEVCGHNCVPFFITPTAGAIGYNWIVPEGLTWEIPVDQPYFLNIFTENSDYGVYEVCVETIYDTGVSDPCCRKLNYSDCTFGEIGDWIWEDINGNGLQEIGEAGIDGALLALYNESLLEVARTTAQNGFYKFTDIPPGTYLIRVLGVNGYIESPGTHTDSLSDSDFCSIYFPLSSDFFILNPGESRTDIDFGLFKGFEVTGRVFIDRNGDGIFAGNESPFKGCEVVLEDALGDLVASTVTDASGSYEFTGLPAGSYSISMMPGAEFVPTMKNAPGSVEERDSDINEDGSTDIFELLNGNTFSFIDGGFFRYSEIGDFVWMDDNKNGLQDPDEDGLAHVQIQMLTRTGLPLITTVSDSSGAYTLAGIPPGHYTIVILPGNASFLPTVRLDSLPDRNSDLNLVNGIFVSDTLRILENTELYSIDFGLLRSQEVSGRVFLDRNGDGIFAGNESPFEDCEVHLEDVNGSLIASTVTDTTGSYRFTGLPAGSYTITMMPGAEYVPTMKNSPGSVEERDSDINENGRTDVFELLNGHTLSFIDGGFFRYSEIGDFVWMDDNKNGLQDPDEDGLANVQIQMLTRTGLPLITTVSDSSGAYALTGIPPGHYTIVILPGNPSFLPTVRLDSLPDRNSDLNLFNGIFVSDTLRILENTALQSIDFGLVLPGATVSGVIYNDSSGDGQLDIDDHVLNNVEVRLYTCNGVLHDIQFSSNGTYAFSPVDPESYYIEVVPPHGFVFSRDGNPDITEDFGAGTSRCLSLDVDQIIEIPVALAPLSVVGDFVWFDHNANGIQDIDESGVQGIDLFLVFEDQVIDLATSDEAGQFLFDSLYPGRYKLMAMNIPDSLEVTAFKTGDDTSDSDFMIASNGLETNEFLLSGGIMRTDLDLGLMPGPGQIEVRIWRDADGDTWRDTDEIGFRNIDVLLYDCAGNQLDVAQPDSNGVVHFAPIAPGLYTIQGVIGDMFYFSEGGDSHVDHSHGYGTTSCVMASSNTSTQVAIGVVPYSVVGNSVWRDLNYNGLQDNSDTGIEGITLQLMNMGTFQDDETVSSANGSYLFDKVRPGTYTVRILNQPDSLLPTVHNRGSDNEDSDLYFDGIHMTTDSFIVVNGTPRLDIDLGLIVPKGQVTGMAWIDQNRDGILDLTDEPGIDGLEVRLMDDQEFLLRSTLTNTDGTYRFTNLVPGDYFIRFSKPEGLGFTAGLAGSDPTINSKVIDVVSGQTDVMTITADELIQNIHAGFIESGNALSGVVFEDLDADGVLDDDPVKTDFMVVLHNDLFQPIDTAFTDTDGAYIFQDLIDGNYRVEFPFADSPRISPANAGNDEQTDSELTLNGGVYSTEIIALAGSPVTGVNAGYYYPVTIGDYVWLDANEDGVQDTIEKGVNSMRVTLFDHNGTLLASTLTFTHENTDGYYIFKDLDPGMFYLVFSLQSSMTFTLYNQGVHPESDSDVTNVNGLGSTEVFQLVSGDVDLSRDAGVVAEPASVGDFIWKDRNGNGIQDDDEEGLNGVAVELYTDEGMLVSSRVSADHPVTSLPGYYLFDQVLPGSYYIVFDIPPGFKASPFNTGGDTSADSDIEGSLQNGSTTIFNLSPGELELDIDGGIFEGGSIGDRVWHDRNLDGLQDPNEPGVENVRVKLYNDNTGFQAETTTDVQGLYGFDDLGEGDYYLVFVPPSDFMLTKGNEGSDPQRDSDADATGTTPRFHLEYNTVIDTIDAGLVRPSNLISGIVWIDVNENGFLDNGEAPVGGHTVWLLTSSEDLLLETHTNLSGRYIFKDLDAGDYRIRFSLPQGFAFTLENMGFNEEVDSDADQTGLTDIITLQTQTVERFVNAGIYETNKRGNAYAKLYPNPVSGISTIMVVVERDMVPVKVECYDPFGQKAGLVMDYGLLPRGVHHLRFDPTLNEGIYYLRVVAGKRITTIKMMVVHD